jgi:hypothetical protein
MRLGGWGCVVAWLASCTPTTVGGSTAGDETSTAGGSGGSAGISTGGTSSGGTWGGVTIHLGQGGTAGAGDTGDDGGSEYCVDSARVVYLVTTQNYLYSFDPRMEGLSAYKRIGTLACETESTPQSMSVDRLGKAYVFYSSGHLYFVDTTTAECTPTSYDHPIDPHKSFNQLGMGFTAATPESNDQVLYIHSPDFGLATISLESLLVNKLDVLESMAAELTGGPDAVLFTFESSTAELSQVDRADYQRRSMHKFNLKSVAAFAFARYAGVFYMFTAPQNGTTSTTMFDPQTNMESVRDPDIGVTVVGAGQSICVPPPLIP